MSGETVRFNILNAWSDSPSIPTDKIGYPSEGLHLERDAVAQFFVEKSWKDVTWEELLKYKGDRSACLSFMSPAAYRYYLPSYMFIALDHYSESDVSADSALFSLSPPSDPSLDRYWSERVAGFSQSQKEAILSFLRFILHEHSDDYVYHKGELDNAIAYWENAL